ncbi:MAG: hypothetical protein AB7E47_12655 [Desulfovibrionaceae bacterium]
MEKRDAVQQLFIKNSLVVGHAFDFSLGILPWAWRERIINALRRASNEWQLPPSMLTDLENITNLLRVDIQSRERILSYDNLISLLNKLFGKDNAHHGILASLAPADYSSGVFSEQEEQQAFRCCILVSLIKSVDSALPKTLERSVKKNLYEALCQTIVDANDLFVDPIATKQALSDGDETLLRFYFWHWQYAQRNPIYKQAIEELRSLLESCQFWEKTKSTELEYRCLLPINIKVQKPHPYAYLFERIQRLMQGDLDQFKLLPTWPVSGYSSEVILSRIEDGSFAYYERQSPPYNPLDLVPTPCQASLEWKMEYAKYQEAIKAFSKDRSDSEFSKATMYLFNIRKNLGIMYARDTLKRIRGNEHSRFIGLWLWDKVHMEGFSKQEAKEALTSQHAKIIGEYSQGKDGKYSAPSDSALYRDLQVAEGCIKSGEVLAIRDAVKR